MYYSTLQIRRLARGGVCGGGGAMVDRSKDLPIQGMDKSTISNRWSTYPMYGKVDLFKKQVDSSVAVDAMNITRITVICLLTSCILHVHVCLSLAYMMIGLQVANVHVQYVF